MPKRWLSHEEDAKKEYYRRIKEVSRKKKAKEADEDEASGSQDIPGAFSRDTNLASELHSLGPMNRECIHCKALHFASESTGRSSVDEFSLCCSKGKVVLPPIKQSPLIHDLLTGNDIDSEDFLSSIRSYNASMAMVSTSMTVDKYTGGGPYFFKAHGQVYHGVGPLEVAANELPCYSQVYIYDVGHATELRMQNPANIGCKALLMHRIASHLEDINPHIHLFKRMHEMTKSSNTVNLDMAIVTAPLTDPRRYNLPTSDDVAIIFQTTDGTPIGERDLRIYKRHETGLQSIPVFSPFLDPLAYPLLIPYGDFGWCFSMQHNPEHSTSKRTRLTMREYAAYRLGHRFPIADLLLSSKLKLQWIVDIYVRQESNQLQFLKDNQSLLRADKYLNLMDAMNDIAKETGKKAGKPIRLLHCGSRRPNQARRDRNVCKCQICGID